MAALRNVVVGSGPSGVAAAAALLDAGEEVLMLDVGREPPPETRALAAALAAREPSAWTAAERAALRGEREPGDPARKRVLGSDYPYLSEREAGLEQRGAKALVSGAKGGLSTVWGAAVLPFPEDELEAWPFPAAELRPHYARAAALLGIAAARDGLEALFPFHAEPREPLRSSRQARLVLERLESRQAELAAAGLSFGRARHAASAAACRDAGTCLSGCAYGAVWCAASTVDALARRPGFRYQGGTRVLALEPRGAGARVHAAPEGRSREVHDADRVFLACGPLATARLVCGSFGAPPAGLPFLAQPYVLLPALLGEAPAGGLEPGAHELAQVFLELKDPAVSPRLVHLQLYGHNHVIADRLSSALAWAGPFAAALERRLGPRLVALQGYLHSDHAGPARVTAAGRGEDCRLRLEAKPSREARAVLRGVERVLSARADALGFRVVSPLARLGTPGEGNHAGGIFPMRAAPGSWETDRQGRLGGKGAVRLVDSSALPSLPAATLTYALMANASRIATEALA